MGGLVVAAVAGLVVNRFFVKMMLWNYRSMHKTTLEEVDTQQNWFAEIDHLFFCAVDDA